MAEPLYSHPVGSAHLDQFESVLGYQRGVIGVHTVKVGDDHVDVNGVEGVEVADGIQGDHRLSQQQVGLSVDVDRGQLGDLDGDRTTEEAMSVVTETRPGHDVEGARLPVVRMVILATRTMGRIMVLPGYGQQVRLHRIGTPQELVGRHRGERRVGPTGSDQLDRLTELGGVDERAGALDEDHDLRIRAVEPDLIQSMQQSRFRAGRGPSQIGGTVDHLSAHPTRRLGDLGVVGAHVGRVDLRRGAG